MPEPQESEVPKRIRNSLKLWKFAYYVWTLVFVRLAALTISMPVAAASGLLVDDSHKYAPLWISLIGGIAAALYTIFIPNEYASGFDAAQAALASAIEKFKAGGINPIQLDNEHEKARVALPKISRLLAILTRRILTVFPIRRRRGGNRHMPERQESEVPKRIKNSLILWKFAYYVWTLVFIVLAALAIIMPLVAASGLLVDDSHKYDRLWISLIGGIAAALYTGFRPNEYASGFDAAQASLASAIEKFKAGGIERIDLANEYEKARSLTVFAIRHRR
jgi:hypothetical protein